MSPGIAGESSGLVVFCELPGSLPVIRARFPGLELVDISGGVPEGLRGDVLFGGRTQNSIAALATGVRWVQLAGTGVDRVAPQVMDAPMLTTARGVGAVAISEYVLATMGAFARNFPENWLGAPPETWHFQPARSLAGATLGLFGFGGIAQRLARLASALDMSVVALRRHPGAGPPDVAMVSSVPELFSRADHLVLAAPATDATRHVINPESIAAMRRGVHLVNIARGSLVDQDVLRLALDEGIIARASLDVTDPEPLPAGHWLYEHPKVFLTAHSSWIGPPQFEAATEYFCDNLERFLAGQPLKGVVGADGY